MAPLTVAGAQPADPERDAQLFDLVTASAIGDGLPTPEIDIVEDPSPNAFATGTSPAHAAVAVTTGLLAIMDREELEGVLGHELSRIKNYKTRLLLVVTTLIGMAGLLASVIWRSAFFVRGRGRDGAQLTAVLVAHLDPDRQVSPLRRRGAHGLGEGVAPARGVDQHPSMDLPAVEA